MKLSECLHRCSCMIDKTPGHIYRNRDGLTFEILNSEQIRCIDRGTDSSWGIGTVVPDSGEWNGTWELVNGKSCGFKNLYNKLNEG